jgi:excisionase family DNA binding protein
MSAKTDPIELPLLAGTAAAQLLGVSYRTVIRLAQQGKLAYVRDSASRRLYRRSDVEKLARTREVERVNREASK